MIRRWFRFLRAKSYDPTAWEKHMPVDELQSVYDGQGWTGVNGQWRQRNLDHLTKKILELANKKKAEVTMLDVACFSGDYFGRLAQQGSLKGKFQYTGADVTPKFVANCTNRWREYSNCQFKQGSALDLPFPDNSFDLVFNSGMLIHVKDPATCIREITRVARSLVLVETKVDPDQKDPFIEDHKSGPEFIDRVYRPDYMRGLLSKYATIVDEFQVPYNERQSLLFEAIPK